MVAFPWHFQTRDPKTKRRNPTQDELFNDEDLSGIAQAVVRESIQNSLDARANMGSPAHVRIFLSGEDEAVSPEKAANYFGQLTPHLLSAYPDRAESIRQLTSKPCQFLVIEDFGTTGLTGNPKRHTLPAVGESDNFFFFFRAEGASGKSDGKRGRWGIGKHTFFSSSQIKSFIALTIRDQANDKSPLVLGQSITRVHPNPSDTTVEVEPDGWMAIDDGLLWMPFEDPATAAQICSDWKLSRQHEPGLSVIMPYCDSKLTLSEIQISILEEYAAPILQGVLKISLESGDGTHSNIDSKTISEIAEGLSQTEPRYSRLRNLIGRLAKTLSPKAEALVELPLMTGNPAWTREFFSDELTQAFTQRIDQLGYVVVRVPVEISLEGEKDKLPKSHFDVGFFAQQESSRSIFIREGVRVTGVGSKTSPFIGLMPIVIINEGALGSLLGDAEGPAHLNWDPRRETFKGKYSHGPSWIEFVRKAPGSIIGYTRGLDKETDYSIGADWFAEPDNERKKKKGTKTTTPKPPPPPPPVVVFSKVKGGVTATLNNANPAAASVVSVRLVMAYDRRRGNPFKRWNPADFQTTDLECTTTSATLVAALSEKNILTFQVGDAQDFSVTIRGFDPNRDVIVRAEYA